MGRYYLDSEGALWDKENMQEAVMSWSIREYLTNVPLFQNAKGDVLIAGLGIGFVLHFLRMNPKVSTITIVEKEKEIIDMIPVPERVIHCDIFDFTPTKKYDTIWIDLWGAQPDTREALAERMKQYLNKDGWIGIWYDR